MIPDSAGQVGSLQPIKEIAEACRQRGILCHTDAAQSIGKVPVKVRPNKIKMLVVGCLAQETFSLFVLSLGSLPHSRL